MQQYMAATHCKLTDITPKDLWRAIVTQKSSRHTECILPSISLERSKCLITKLPMAKYPNMPRNLGYQSQYTDRLCSSHTLPTQIMSNKVIPNVKTSATI